MEQKRRVNRFAHRLVAAEREREIAHAAAEIHAGALRSDLPRRLDEIDGVLVVLFQPGRDGQNVGIEDDVVGIEIELLGEQPVRACANVHLARDGVGLPRFVERHHDDPGAVLLNAPRFLQKILFAFLQADRVHHGLALDALQPRLEHRPLRAVDHDRDARNLWLGRNQIQKMRHRLF